MVADYSFWLKHVGSSDPNLVVYMYVKKNVHLQFWHFILAVVNQKRIQKEFLTTINCSFRNILHFQVKKLQDIFIAHFIRKFISLVKLDAIFLSFEL